MLTASLALMLTGCSPSAVESGTPEPVEPWFTLLVIPDTQYITLNPEPLPMLREMMDWILENHEALGIAMVLQEGDITHNNTTKFNAWFGLSAIRMSMPLSSPNVAAVSGWWWGGTRGAGRRTAPSRRGWSGWSCQ